jgi:hypothetical protein
MPAVAPATVPWPAAGAAPESCGGPAAKRRRTRGGPSAPLSICYICYIPTNASSRPSTTAAAVVPASPSNSDDDDDDDDDDDSTSTSESSSDDSSVGSTAPRSGASRGCACARPPACPRAHQHAAAGVPPTMERPSALQTMAWPVGSPWSQS